MTHIDCRTANGLEPEQYIGEFVRHQSATILLATDEEWKDFVRLDAASARFLGTQLMRLADKVRGDRR